MVHIHLFTGTTANIPLTAVSTPNSDTEVKDVWKWGVNISLHLN